MKTLNECVFRVWTHFVNQCCAKLGEPLMDHMARGRETYFQPILIFHSMYV